MDEFWFRLLVVAAVGAVALVWARLSRTATVLRRRPSTLPGLDPGVVLFTSETCSTCSRARTMLESIGVEYREIDFESHPEVFTRLGISKVPTFASVRPGGKGWVASGVPGEWRLRRWLRGP